MIRNKPRGATVYGVDFGKKSSTSSGLDSAGECGPAGEVPPRHAAAFFERAERSRGGHGRLPGSQWLARKLQAMGHTVRIIPAQFVKPYVKSHKNDTIDAAAIAEAVTRPTMRFVRSSSPSRWICRRLHRIRDQMVAKPNATDLPDASLLPRVRGRDPPGRWHVQARSVRGSLPTRRNDLTPTMRRLLTELFEDLMRLEKRIAEVTREIEALAASDERARRLMTIPGIGPLGATALLAAAGDGRQFRKARDMAAWLGLVPREHSTGGKTTLLGISKRGNRYLRRLLIHGARSCVMHLDRSRDRLGGMARRPARADARQQGHRGAGG